MNDQPYQEQARLDLTTANAVDGGLRLQQAAGARAAGKFMQSHHVPFCVIVRVLMEPGRRRPPNLADTAAPALPPVPRRKF